MVVFVLAAGIAWNIKKTPPFYSESANVIFTAPAINPYNSIGSFDSALTGTAFMMKDTMLSPELKQKVREAGGIAAFSLEVVNIGNEQYPYYPYPYVTLTTTATNPADAHRTFTIVALSFQHLVLERQVQAGVKPASRISTHVVADTGPVSLAGSSKRTFAGLMLLAIVAAFMVAIFLDRHPIWPGIRRHLPRYSSMSGRARIAPPTRLPSKATR
jgi:hypothetical protein